MSVEDKDNRIRGLNFEVDNGEETGLYPQHQVFTLAVGNCGPTHYWRTVWCTSETAAELRQDPYSMDCVYPQPDSTRFAGLYVTCHDFHAIGALYEPLASE
ncbi:hypothetical protein BDW62DRAFT_35331 [Aspergillus aurantiobrunneus]